MIDQDRLVGSFCDLVRIDSPSEEEEEVAQHLIPRLEKLGLTVERDSFGNVIASEGRRQPSPPLRPHGHRRAGPGHQAPD